MNKDNYFIKKYIVSIILLTIIFMLAITIKNRYILLMLIIVPCFMNYSTYKLTIKSNKNKTFIFITLTLISILAIIFQIFFYNKITNLISSTIFIITIISPPIIYNNIIKE